MGVPVAIALGSNLGDRRQHLQAGLEQLQRHLTNIQVAAVIETEPAEVAEPQPPYLNTVAVGETDLSADRLLAELMRIEKLRGRRRPSARAPRTLDLDLILYGDAVIDSPRLTVPHPRFRQRRFVLEPLAELVPGWKDPVTGRTVGQLLRGLEGS
jgi:2-amino-4-hydroxy-6-hydroxymethyldihydropteridine diphosphokinase